MKKMKENPLEHKTISPYSMEGYLYVQEKRECPGPLVTWGALMPYVQKVERVSSSARSRVVFCKYRFG